MYVVVNPLSKVQVMSVLLWTVSQSFSHICVVVILGVTVAVNLCEASLNMYGAVDIHYSSSLVAMYFVVSLSYSLTISDRFPLRLLYAVGAKTVP